MSDKTDFMVTQLGKRRGIISKRISLGEDGKPESDGTQCALSRGVASGLQMEGMTAFAKHLNKMASEDALTLGCIKRDKPDKVWNIVARGKLATISDKKALKKTVARTLEHFEFPVGKRGVMLVDHDRKGAPDGLDVRPEDILALIKDGANAGWVKRASTSAGLSNSETGECNNRAGATARHAQGGGGWVQTSTLGTSTARGDNERHTANGNPDRIADLFYRMKGERHAKSDDL